MPKNRGAGAVRDAVNLTTHPWKLWMLIAGLTVAVIGLVSSDGDGQKTGALSVKSGSRNASIGCPKTPSNNLTQTCFSDYPVSDNISVENRIKPYGACRRYVIFSLHITSLRDVWREESPIIYRYDVPNGTSDNLNCTREKYFFVGLKKSSIFAA